MASESVLIRQRVAEALGRAGLSDQAVAAEVLLLLPVDFVDQYERLFLAAWKAPGTRETAQPSEAGVASPRATKWRTASGQTETRGAASTRGRPRGRGIQAGDLRAQSTKEWADRKLRKLARDIRSRLADEDVGVRRCTGRTCRRLAEDTWNYCPNCGAPTEDVVT